MRPNAPPASPVRNTVVVVILLLAAILPRISSTVVLGVDEASHWRERSQAFLDGLQAGNLADTDVAYHPGVITLWLGTSGVALNRIVNGPDFYAVNPVDYYALLRLPMAIFNAVGIVVSFMLLRRLFPQPIALLATLFWIFDPFVVAHSQIVHTDSPVMVLGFITFLLALIALGFDRRDHVRSDHLAIHWRWWIVTGICLGLTVVAKLNGLLVVAAIGVLMLQIYRRRLVELSWWLRVLKAMVALVLIAALTFFAAFPAMWVEPMETFMGLFDRANDLVQAGHPQFFIGEITRDPGLFFYVVTTVFRITPLLLIGLLLALITFTQQHRVWYLQSLLALLVYLFVLFIITSLQAKKADRYVLPIFPVLYVYAAVGLTWFSERLEKWAARRFSSYGAQVVRITLIVVLSVLLVLPILRSYPYMMTYYNPLLGGPKAASQALVIGWGEGLDRAAAFVNETSGDDCRFVISDFPDVTDAFTRCESLPARSCAYARIADDPSDGFIITYISYTQRNMNATLRRAVEGLAPAHTVEFQGVPLASVYRAADSNLDVLREAGADCSG